MKTRLRYLFEDWIDYFVVAGVGVGSALLVYLLITYKGV